MNNFNSFPKKNNGFIYKYTSPSGKSYIGQTIRSLKERAKKNGKGYINSSLFYNAIQKYGFENMTWEILGEYPVNELNEKEITFIKQYNSLSPNGYNLLKGGNNKEIGLKRKTKIVQYDLTGKFIK